MWASAHGGGAHTAAERTRRRSGAPAPSRGAAARAEVARAEHWARGGETAKVSAVASAARRGAVSGRRGRRGARGDGERRAYAVWRGGGGAEEAAARTYGGSTMLGSQLAAGTYTRGDGISHGGSLRSMRRSTRVWDSSEGVRGTWSAGQVDARHDVWLVGRAPAVESCPCREQLCRALCAAASRAGMSMCTCGKGGGRAERRLGLSGLGPQSAARDTTVYCVGIPSRLVDRSLSRVSASPALLYCTVLRSALRTYSTDYSTRKFWWA